MGGTIEYGEDYWTEAGFDLANKNDITYGGDVTFGSATWDYFFTSGFIGESGTPPETLVSKAAQFTSLLTCHSLDCSIHL